MIGASFQIVPQRGDFTGRVLLRWVSFWPASATMFWVLGRSGSRLTASASHFSEWAAGRGFSAAYQSRRATRARLILLSGPGLGVRVGADGNGGVWYRWRRSEPGTFLIHRIEPPWKPSGLRPRDSDLQRARSVSLWRPFPLMGSSERFLLFQH